MVDSKLIKLECDDCVLAVKENIIKKSARLNKMANRTHRPIPIPVESGIMKEIIRYYNWYDDDITRYKEYASKPSWVLADISRAARSIGMYKIVRMITKASKNKSIVMTDDEIDEQFMSISSDDEYF